MLKHENCALCGSTAAVWVTWVECHRLETAVYCSTHAEEQGIFDPKSYDFCGSGSASGSKASNLEEQDAFGCDICGMTQRKFDKLGRFGCGECYGTFFGGLKPLLQKIHVGDRHYGKIPNKAASEDLLKFRIERLETKLRKAVANEHYEDAARFRDRIREMERRTPERGVQ